MRNVKGEEFRQQKIEKAIYSMACFDVGEPNFITF